MQERNQFQKPPHPASSLNSSVFAPRVPGGEMSTGEITGKVPTPLPAVASQPPSPHPLPPGNANNTSQSGLQGLSDAPDGLLPRMPSSPFDDGEARSSSTAQQQKRRRITVILLSSILLVLVALGFVFWNLAMSAAPSVTLYQVSSQSASQDIGGGGIIYPRQQLDISYPVAERVVGVMVKPGDQVALNQPLIQLDPSLLNAQIEQASNDMSAAQAYLNAVSNSRNSVTVAQAQQAYNLAKDKYDALVAQSSSPLLRKGNLIAPMSGVITTVNVNPGEVFAAGSPMLTIMDESVVIAHVKVPLTDLGQVHLGQTAQVTPSALPGQVFQGTVTEVIPQADPQTDTFEVWVAVANSTMTLLPGMSAYVRIQTPAKAMTVPRLAVLNADSFASVFVVHGAQAYQQPVHVVGRSVGTVIVDKGLSPGDKVVLVGLDSMRNGETVHVMAVER
jgi:RND family efflux transporter MFP subunit